MEMTKQSMYSPLGRAHLHVTLSANLHVSHLVGLSDSERVTVLAETAARWSHVVALDLSGAAGWTAIDAVSLLRSPGLQRVPATCRRMQRLRAQQPASRGQSSQLLKPQVLHDEMDED